MVSGQTLRDGPERGMWSIRAWTGHYVTSTLLDVPKVWALSVEAERTQQLRWMMKGGCEEKRRFPEEEPRRRRCPGTPVVSVLDG